jgi:hypothetical protein
VRRASENDILARLLPRLDRHAEILPDEALRQFPVIIQFHELCHDLFPQPLHDHTLPDHGEQHILGVDAGRGMAGNLLRIRRTGCSALRLFETESWGPPFAARVKLLFNYRYNITKKQPTVSSLI